MHINHQLQPNASDTESFCRDLCDRLGVPLVVERVTVAAEGNSAGGGGIEEAARKARYSAFEALMQRGADSVILGCTEIGLVLTDGNSALPVYDSARIHCEAAMDLACA